MEQEYLYLPSDQDQVSDSIELSEGKAALLYIKGNRENQEDALWASVHEGRFIMCSSDGMKRSEGGDEMAKWVVEYGKQSAQAQINETGTVDVLQMQRFIRDSIRQRAPSHTGKATSLCLLIDGKKVSAHRVGDPDLRVDQEIFPDPALVPENKGSIAFREWWEREGQNADPAEVMRKMDLERQRLLTQTNADSKLLTNYHSGSYPNNREIPLSPGIATLNLKNGQRLVGGTDGLENLRLNNWYNAALPLASNPQIFLFDLWDILMQRRGENASGVAFFCKQ